MRTVQFGTLFRFIRNGVNVKQDKSGSGLPITRIETIAGAIVDGTRVGYADLEEVDCHHWLLEPGDILFSHINSVEHIGKCAVYRGTPEKLVHGMNLLCLRSDMSKVLPEFAKYLIRGPEFRSRLSNFINRAVNQASVSIGNLKTILVTLPPVEEQRRIARVLDQAEALRAKRRAGLAQLDTLTQSVFLDMFGDSTSNAQGWHVVALRDLVSEFRYGTSTKSQSTGKPTLRIPNVIGGHLDLTDVKMVPVKPADFERLRLIDGDLLIVRTNGNPDSVGRCAVFESACIANGGYDSEGFIYASYLIRARPLSGIVSPIFLREFMLGAAGRRALRSRSKTSAGQYNLNTEGLGSITVPVPPLVIQQEFARRVAAVEELKSTHRASLAALDALFASLQHRALGGEL